GRISVESVVRCSWNGWPDDRGIRRVPRPAGPCRGRQGRTDRGGARPPEASQERLYARCQARSRRWASALSDLSRENHLWRPDLR
ncbi:hypothetical protein FA132_34745, partial [Pseudomonas aeruginosa]|nr:hypothetical protein [Pseudomonas aeruginosa]